MFLVATVAFAGGYFVDHFKIVPRETKTVLKATSFASKDPLDVLDPPKRKCPKELHVGDLIPKGCGYTLGGVEQ
jgi:hypothetical protein